MSTVKRSRSTVSPASAAISIVKSIGNPYVSCSAKAFSPEIVVLPESLVSAATVSKSMFPVLKVWANAFSSPAAILRIRSRESLSSGYWGAITLIADSHSVRRVCSFAPSNRIFRITLRISRRNTYPRPSLPGITPSEIKKMQVRE